MKGSDLPKKSFLSSLLAQNCMVALSCRDAWECSSLVLCDFIHGGLFLILLPTSPLLSSQLAGGQQMDAAVCASHNRILNTAWWKSIFSFHVFWHTVVCVVVYIFYSDSQTSGLSVLLSFLCFFVVVVVLNITKDIKTVRLIAALQILGFPSTSFLRSFPGALPTVLKEFTREDLLAKKNVNSVTRKDHHTSFCTGNRTCRYHLFTQQLKYDLQHLFPLFPNPKCHCWVWYEGMTAGKNWHISLQVEFQTTDWNSFQIKSSHAIFPDKCSFFCIYF